MKIKFYIRNKTCNNVYSRHYYPPTVNLTKYEWKIKYSAYRSLRYFPSYKLEVIFTYKELITFDYAYNF